MASRNATTLAGLLLGMALCQPFAMAEEGFSIKPEHTLRKVLEQRSGTVVSLQMQSGQELTGTVVQVGNDLVHISQLSGRDFYDAAVEIGRIEAIIVRARTK